MNIPEFTENVNIHQSLPDQPTLTPTELKIKWDEGVSKIKNYINLVLLPALRDGVTSELESSKQDILDSVNDLLSELENDIGTTIKELDSKITAVNNSIASINSKLSTVTNATTASITMGSGIAKTHAYVFKQGNVVTLYVEGTCNVPGYTPVTLFTLPSGFRPGSSRKMLSLWSKDDFDGMFSATVNANGQCQVGTVSVGMTKFVVQGSFML